MNMVSVGPDKSAIYSSCSHLTSFPAQVDTPPLSLYIVVCCYIIGLNMDSAPSSNKGKVISKELFSKLTETLQKFLNSR